MEKHKQGLIKTSYSGDSHFEMTSSCLLAFLGGLRILWLSYFVPSVYVVYGPWTLAERRDYHTKPLPIILMNLVVLWWSPETRELRLLHLQFSEGQTLWLPGLGSDVHTLANSVNRQWRTVGQSPGVWSWSVNRSAGGGTGAPRGDETNWLSWGWREKACDIRLMWMSV